MGHVTLTKLFEALVVICSLALASVNLSTKFEVFNSTHYKDTKGDTQLGKWGGLIGVWWGHLSSLKIAPFNRAHTSSYI